MLLRYPSHNRLSAHPTEAKTPAQKTAGLALLVPLEAAVGEEVISLAGNLGRKNQSRVIQRQDQVVADAGQSGLGHADGAIVWNLQLLYQPSQPYSQ